MGDPLVCPLLKRSQCTEWLKVPDNIRNDQKKNGLLNMGGVISLEYKKEQHFC